MKFKGYDDCQTCKGAGWYTVEEFDGYDRTRDYRKKCWACYVVWLQKNDLGFGVKLRDEYLIVEKQNGKYVMYTSTNGDIHWTNITLTETQLKLFAYRALTDDRQYAILLMPE